MHSSHAHPLAEPADPVIAELLRQIAALRRVTVRVMLGERVATERAEALRQVAVARGLDVDTGEEANDGP